MEDIIVKIDTKNLGMSRKEVIQVIPDIRKKIVVCSSRESLGLTHSGEAYDTF